MSTYEYGKLELDKINKDKDGFQESINNMILDLLKLFDEQGHSGTTAHYVINAFTKLASFKPLFPLTDEDDEWEKVGTDMWQNKRCSSVFKDSNGAYDIDGMIVSDNGGYTWFTSRDFTKYMANMDRGFDLVAINKNNTLKKYTYIWA